MNFFFYSIFLLSSVAFSQELYTDVDDIWDQIHRGEYKIDHESDNGGIYVPVIKDDGAKIYIIRDYDQMLSLLRPPLIVPRYASCEDCLDEQKKNYPEIMKPSESCRNLKLEPKYYKKEILTVCLADIKRRLAIGNKPITQLQTLKNLYKLPKYQQDFAASIFTAYGEGRSEDEEEIALIYKTMSNRIEYAKAKGCTSANALDIALQYKQFSMWNKKDPNWKKTVTVKHEEKSEARHQSRMIDTFIKFTTNKYKFDPKKVLDKIYHYRTKKIKTVPAWGKSSIAQKIIKVNGKNIGRSNYKLKNAHYFFKSVAWSFKYLSIRPKDKTKGEEECY